MLNPFLLAQFARPLKTIDRRLPWVEKLIQAPLNEEDIPLVRAACRQSGGRLMGSFYHWYLQKLLRKGPVRQPPKDTEGGEKTPARPMSLPDESIDGGTA